MKNYGISDLSLVLVVPPLPDILLARLEVSALAPPLRNVLPEFPLVPHVPQDLQALPVALAALPLSLVELVGHQVAHHPHALKAVLPELPLVDQPHLHEETPATVGNPVRHLANIGRSVLGQQIRGLFVRRGGTLVRFLGSLTASGLFLLLLPKGVLLGDCQHFLQVLNPRLQLLQPVLQVPVLLPQPLILDKQLYILVLGPVEPLLPQIGDCFILLCLLLSHHHSLLNLPQGIGHFGNGIGVTAVRTDGG
jgi:hypothetical protein